LAKNKLRCSTCGARLTSSEYIGRSMDLTTTFYRCRYCGTVVAVRDLEDVNEG